MFFHFQPMLALIKNNQIPSKSYYFHLYEPSQSICKGLLMVVKWDMIVICCPCAALLNKRQGCSTVPKTSNDCRLSYGCFPKWGYPNNWMVYKCKIHQNTTFSGWWLGVPPWLWKPPSVAYESGIAPQRMFNVHPVASSTQSPPASSAAAPP